MKFESNLGYALGNDTWGRGKILFIPRGWMCTFSFPFFFKKNECRPYPQIGIISDGFQVREAICEICVWGRLCTLETIKKYLKS